MRILPGQALEPRAACGKFGPMFGNMVPGCTLPAEILRPKSEKQDGIIVIFWSGRFCLERWGLGALRFVFAMLFVLCLWKPSHRIANNRGNSGFFWSWLGGPRAHLRDAFAGSFSAQSSSDFCGNSCRFEAAFLA